ncbi:hypothetical protein AABB24_011020, partial [Solanum stoloniferum]
VQVLSIQITLRSIPDLQFSRISWSERYIALVKFMRSKDLVMRTLINDVELHILASATMCTDSQKKKCEICGDIDFDKAITTCYKCNNVDVHRYCMLGCCVDAPMDWCCEESDIRKGIMSTSSGLENVHYEGSKLHAFEKICQSIVQPKKHSKYPRAYRINGEKKVQTGKMRYLPVEEALGLSSSIKKYGSTLINTVSSRVVSTKSIATMTRAIFSKPRAQISNSFREKSKVQQPLASTRYTKPQNLRIAKNTEHRKKNVQVSKGSGWFYQS